MTHQRFIESGGPDNFVGVEEKTKKLGAEHAGALKQLRGMLPYGSTVYVITRSVSKTKTSRVLDFYCIADFGAGPEMQWIGYRVGLVIGKAWGVASRGIRIQGNGLNVASHYVRHLLSRALYGEDNAVVQFTMD